MKPKSWIISVVAIVGIAAMQMFALARGHDGVVLTTCVAMIAGIAGYQVHSQNLITKHGKKQYGRT